jgi:hypothetical protein
LLVIVEDAQAKLVSLHLDEQESRSSSAPSLTIGTDPLSFCDCMYFIERVFHFASEEIERFFCSEDAHQMLSRVSTPRAAAALLRASTWNETCTLSSFLYVVVISSRNLNAHLVRVRVRERANTSKRRKTGKNKHHIKTFTHKERS